MLVQTRTDRLRLFTQHDHGLTCGDLVHAWTAGPLRDPAPSWMVLAHALHDMAWVDEDVAPRLNPATAAPHDFVDMPLAPKIAMYARGVDEVERIEPRVAVLNSLHYQSFVPAKEAPDFHAAEEARREQLRDRLQISGAAWQAVLDAYPLLRATDRLSLWICLAAPGAREDRVPSWLPPWLPVGDDRYALGWRDADTVTMDPLPFDRPVELHLPWRDLDATTFATAEDLAAAWDAAERGVWTVRIVGA